MRQSTRGDVQWSGGTSDPSGVCSCNFVRSPSGTASALVRLLPTIMAVRTFAQSIRRNRVSGGPAWSEGHSFHMGTTMTLPSWPIGQILRKAAAPPRAFAALATCAPLSGCVLSAGETRTWLLYFYGFETAKIRFLGLQNKRALLPCASVCVCVAAVSVGRSAWSLGQCSTGHGCLCGPCQLGSMAQRCLTCA